MTTKRKTNVLGVATGHDIREDEQKRLGKTQPEQLTLFQTFLSPEDHNKYSNTIELYDAIPKYYTNKKKIAELRLGPEGQEVFLRTLEREFRHRDTTYKLQIKPARIKEEDGTEIEYYPSEQEELVEEALRKIASDRLNGVFLEGEAGVQFTMSELRKELKERGHTMSDQQLKRALWICRETSLTIEKIGDEEDAKLSFNIFPTVMISNRKGWRNDPQNTLCYVQFNPLVTKSVNELSCYQFDYEKLMGFRWQLTRWLHKRLSHNYRQAHYFEGDPYTIKFSTIKQGSGLLNNARISEDIKSVDRSFEELKNDGVIMSLEKEIRRGRRNKIEDVVYRIRPTVNFTAEIKKANKRAGDQITHSPVRLPAHEEKTYSLPEAGEGKGKRGRGWKRL